MGSVHEDLGCGDKNLDCVDAMKTFDNYVGWGCAVVYKNFHDVGWGCVDDDSLPNDWHRRCDFCCA